MAGKRQSYEIKNPCGYGIIIVNSFDGIEKQERDKTDDEKKYFERLFELIGLEIIHYKELKKQEILSNLGEIARKDKLKDHSMIAVAISSHGSGTGLYGVDIQERLDRMENNESLEGLDDIITLGKLKEVFSFDNCPNLKHKPKLLLLNGWKEGACETFFKCDAGSTMPEVDKSHILAICSSFDNCATFLHSEKLPPSLFPRILFETINNYKSEPINNLVNVVNGELLKSSKKIIRVNDTNIAINESCTQGSKVPYELSFCFRDSGPASANQQPTT